MGDSMPCGRRAQPRLGASGVFLRGASNRAVRRLWDRRCRLRWARRLVLEVILTGCPLPTLPQEPAAPKIRPDHIRQSKPGNAIYGWITGDLLAGLNIGALGSYTVVTGVQVGQMPSQRWFSLTSFFSARQPTNNDYYNQWAAAMSPISDAYTIRWVCQFRSVWPNNGERKSDSFHSGDERMKQPVANKRNGVEGNNGRNAPIATRTTRPIPSPR
jgi:hypothetical protein